MDLLFCGYLEAVFEWRYCFVDTRTLEEGNCPVCLVPLQNVKKL